MTINDLHKQIDELVKQGKGDHTLYMNWESPGPWGSYVDSERMVDFVEIKDLENNSIYMRMW